MSWVLGQDQLERWVRGNLLGWGHPPVTEALGDCASMLLGWPTLKEVEISGGQGKTGGRTQKIAEGDIRPETH